MSQALEATSIPGSALPGIGTALAFMAGSAVVGGLIGASLSLRKRSLPWLYGGIGAGVLVGGGVGYFGGRMIVSRSIAKLQEKSEEESGE